MRLVGLSVVVLRQRMGAMDAKTMAILIILILGFFAAFAFIDLFQDDVEEVE